MKKRDLTWSESHWHLRFRQIRRRQCVERAHLQQDLRQEIPLEESLGTVGLHTFDLRHPIWSALRAADGIQAVLVDAFRASYKAKHVYSNADSAGPHNAWLRKSGRKAGKSVLAPRGAVTAWRAMRVQPSS